MKTPTTIMFKAPCISGLVHHPLRDNRWRLTGNRRFDQWLLLLGLMAGFLVGLPAAAQMADLTVSQITSPSTLAAGQTLTLAFTMTNQGNATANGPWTNQFL